ncbi:LamG-like jellyroll fold domain-containing protein [Pedobacter borealis]|uniref:LamG-like jellyroll fold domain-containing protein n=1 Tax=Pedobacter borealis TaxID=475254 RepID=UPI000492EEBF|nr:LamG-like jellyroll fold domain-containing protein [Pedobacter borealis]
MNKLFTPASTFKRLGWFSVLLLILSGSGCNKDFSNTLPTTYKNDTLGRGAGKKVLYIVLDGVTGTALKTLAPTTIMQINTRATYSFDGLADDNLNTMTNAQAWTTMFTGVEYTKHNVTSEDFTGLNVEATPTIFTRIKSNVNGARTVSIASTSLFNDKLAGDATEKINAANDEAVKTAVVNDLKTKNSNLIVAQFHSAETAGAANGYTASTPSYASAILAIDGYINEILTAMRTREGFSGENWLVVIASNKGGGVSGGLPGSNIYGDISRNTYVAFYNPKFSPLRINKPDDNSYPFVGTAPRFLMTGTTEVFAKLSNTSVGNFGGTGNYTLMFKIRNDAATDTSWPPFMGKKSDFTAVASGGYLFSFAGTSFQFDFGNSSRPNVSVIRDAKWHTLAITITTVSGVRTLNVFSDGIKRYGLTVTNQTVDNTVGFRIGTAIAAGKVTDFLLRDLAIYNIALTDDEVIANMKKENSTSIIYPANLVGWWPCNDGSGFVLKDKSGKNNDFTLSSNGTWTTFNELSPNVGGNITQEAYSAVPNGVDIPVLIYNWLNIAVPSNWGLTGKLYTPTVTLPTN